MKDGVASSLFWELLPIQQSLLQLWLGGSLAEKGLEKFVMFLASLFQFITKLLEESQYRFLGLLDLS